MLTPVQGGHWTLNNALLNDTFLKELRILLCPHEVEFNHKENHIRCFPHVTNVCSNHVIEAFTNITLVDDTGDSLHLHWALQVILIPRPMKKQFHVIQSPCAGVLYKQYMPQVNDVTICQK